MTLDLDTDLAASLQRGQTLPASWYTTEDTWEHEKGAIFQRCWQYIGLQEDLSSHGDFVTAQLGDIPIVVVRDADGTLRGFVNVCRHRGATLVLEERGRKKSIQCHYHAWCYGLDGRLRSAPGTRGEPDFHVEDYALEPILVDTWGPFLFVNPDLDAAPLAETLGDLPVLVAETGLDLDRIRVRRRDSYDIAANWKVVVDNYLECYHCPVAHPGFSDLIDLDAYTIREYNLFSTQTGEVTEKARTGRSGLYTIGAGVETGFYVYLWPNFMLNIYPGPGNVSLNLILPEGVHRTRAVYEYCFVDAVGETEVNDFVAFIDQVQREDTVLCESVQRGLRSGRFDRGTLLLSRERALRHFQLLVHRHLRG